MQGDYVVKHFGFNLEDALHLEASFGLDGGEGLLGYAAQAAIGFGGGDLHIQPALEFGLLAPDGTHFGECVALDHRLARLNNSSNLWGRVMAQKNPSHEGLGLNAFVLSQL